MKARIWTSRWIDRGLLGAAALAVVAQATAAARGAPDPAELEVGPLVGQLHDYFAAGPEVPTPPVPSDAATRLARTLGPAGVPDAAPFPGWVLHKRPTFLFGVTPPPPPPPLAHGEPSVAVVAVGHGWVELEATGPTLLRMQAVALALERRRDGEPWTVLGTLEPKAPRWTDRRVEPEASYRYRVVSTARLDREDPAVLAAGLQEAPEELARRASPPVVAELPADVLLVLTSVTLGDPLAARPGAAQVAIDRWDPERSRYQRRWVLVAVGAEVGETGWWVSEVGVDRATESGRVRSIPWARLRRGGAERRLEAGLPGRE